MKQSSWIAYHCERSEATPSGLRRGCRASEGASHPDALGLQARAASKRRFAPRNDILIQFSKMKLIISIICTALVFMGSFMFVPANAEQQSVSETSCKSRTAAYHKNGVLRKCKLNKPMNIQGYPCQRWVRFHKNGTLKQFVLSEDFIIQGISVSAKSMVFLYDNGRLQKCWFSKNVTIQSIPCKGSAFGKVTTAFHQNGNLKWCSLSEPTTIQGIPCEASVFVGVKFYPSGMLRGCTLAKHITIDEKEYQRGARLILDENRNIILHAKND